ncbi:MAG TPA: hypothetical protein PLY32_04870 [Salinivirgaceae bacterium]|nr:hypothetical protein [Salinivirgaceae bacterium]HQA76433.1 hypothetical protein [Salinivirgaceae bacterium]
MKFNKFIHGFLSGIIITTLVFALFVYRNWDSFGSWEGLYRFIKYGKAMAPLISLCALPNLILFLYFMRTDRYKAGRGLIVLTVIFTIIVFILKFNTFFEN